MNHEPRTADSSGRSEHWIKLNWLPGVTPSPSVVKEQFPVTTHCNSVSAFPTMRTDCGSMAGAARNSTFFLIQAAHSRASQRI
ncbi:MAG: hypothetical protein ACLQNE_19660 [Thermoguttaceae bacterium]